MKVLYRLFVRLFHETLAHLACRILESKEVLDRLPAARVIQLSRSLQELESSGEYHLLQWRTECYSQEGEDILLGRIFGEKCDGFYVDIGAHHAARYSNTYLLYRKGWRGINVDATPGSMESFRRLRPRDINIECLVASDDRPRPFFILNEPALNTASEKLAQSRSRDNALYQVTKTVMLKPRSLAAILNEHLPKGQRLDLLSIDVEGLDLDVLRSNDWQSYRPTVVLVELLATSLDDLYQNAVVEFLRGKSYRPIAKLYNTVLFQ